MKLHSCDEWIIAKPESNDHTTDAGLYLPDSTDAARRMRVQFDACWVAVGGDGQPSTSALMAGSVILVDPQARIVTLPDGLVAFKDDAVIAKVADA